MTSLPEHEPIQEPESESTLILPAGEPATASPVAIPENPPLADGGSNPPADVTLKMVPSPEIHPDRTLPIPIQSLPLPETREATVPTLIVPPHQEIPRPTPPAVPAPTILREKQPSTGLPGWIWALFGALGALIIAGIAWFFLSGTESSTRKPSEGSDETSTPTPNVEVVQTDVPAALRPYLEKARTGDVPSMHMLAVMYYNGLNVRQNREEGLKWYRKAAEAGSAAAKKELKQIEAMSSK